MMRRTLLMQRMEEVLTPRELNLVRSYLGIGQPDEASMTFQELAIYLNYNGPSGAEKAYKAALRKLKKDLYGGAYGRWLSAQKAIRAAKAEAEQDAGQRTTPQRTWWEEQALANRFACEVAALIHVHEIFSDALENIAGMILRSLENCTFSRLLKIIPAQMRRYKADNTDIFCGGCKARPS